MVEQVYHQISGGQPHLVESRFSRKLESDEQLYERHSKIGEEGGPLDCGWIKEAGQLIIINHEGQNLQVNPTDEEREELRGKVLQLYTGDPENCWLIPPGESMRAYPLNAPNLRIRSLRGVIRFSLYLFPR